MPRARRPWTALAFAISIVVIELVFWSCSEPLSGIPFFEPTMDVAVLVAKRHMAQEAGGSIVLVGDSACGMDLIPDELEHRLGHPVVNLGTVANFTMPGFVLLAEEAMQCEPPPRAVVFVMVPHTLNMTEQEARDFGQLGRYLLAYHGCSDVYQPSLKDWREWIFFKHRFNLFSPQAGGSFKTYCSRLEQSRGWDPERGKYKGTAKPRTGFMPSPFSSDSLRKFVHKARGRGMPVSFLWAPTPSDAYERGYLPAAQREIRAVAASAPWMRVFQNEPPTWPDSKFGSVTHLNSEAAKEFTGWFGRIYKDNLTTPVQSSGDSSCPCHPDVP